MSQTDLRFLYQALLSGDPTASRRLVEACRRPLYTILRRYYSILPEEVMEDAAHDALLAIIRHPERYDAKQGSILNYLTQIARNKIKDRLEALRGYREIYVGGIVELALVEENNFHEGVQERDIGGASDEMPPEIDALVREILPDVRDRRIWHLICQGRTSVDDFAEVLEITDWPLEQRKSEVKRHRERVHNRVKRRQKEFRRLIGC